MRQFLLLLALALVSAETLRSEQQARLRTTAARAAQGRAQDFGDEEQEQEENENENEDKVDAVDRAADDDDDDSDDQQTVPRPTVPVPQNFALSGVPEAAGPDLNVKVTVTSGAEDDGGEGDEGDESDSTRTKAQAKDAAARFEVAKSEKAYVKWQKELADNQAKQHFIGHQIEDLQDEEGFGNDVDAAVGKVRNETQTIHMAAFLGEMWKEMRMFAGPFYVEHLENKTLTLQRQEKVISKKFDEAKEKLEEAKKKL